MATRIRVAKAKIKVNKAQCLLCGDVLESKHRWDFKTCFCGEISINGGKDYLKRSVKHYGNLIELSEYYD